MKWIVLLSIVLLVFGCHTNNEIRKSKYSLVKINDIPTKEESFDTTLRFQSDSIRLKCVTKCEADFSVSDTINDSIVNLYQDRYFEFVLQHNSKKIQFNVTKNLIKDHYNDSTFRKSVLVYPAVDSIDTVRKTIIIRSAFMYPSGLGGTDFFETILFEISPDGNVKLNKVIPYQDPGFD
jgi:hypothetical protein